MKRIFSIKKSNQRTEMTMAAVLIGPMEVLIIMIITAAVVFVVMVRRRR